jgi:hypothetical protein
MQRTADPREFLRWDHIGTLLAQGTCRGSIAEMKRLKRFPQWRQRWSPLLDCGTVGRPVRYLFAPRTTGSAIQHVHHLALFEQEVGRPIDSMKLIVEFGGGYGGLCRLIHKLGFNGAYVIFDLPEMLALQRYFLRSHQIQVHPGAEFCRADGPAGSGVFLFSDLQELRRSLSDSVRPSPALVMATWSLSESPLDLRREFLRLVEGFEFFLIVYQPEFAGISNDTYFSDWAAKHAGEVNWTKVPIPHMPGNFYLLGRR